MLPESSMSILYCKTHCYKVLDLSKNSSLFFASAMQSTHPHAKRIKAKRVTKNISDETDTKKWD